MSTLLKVVTHWVQDVFMGGHLTKGQPDPKSDQMGVHLTGV